MTCTKKRKRRVRLPGILDLWAGFVYLFLIGPSVIIIPMSFGQKEVIEFPPSRLSLYLYRTYFSDPSWMRATVQSFKVAIATALIATLVGSLASFGLTRGQFRGKRLVMVGMLSPLLVPSVVIALGLYLYLGRLGLAGTTVGLILGHTVLAVPFVLLNVIAALKGLDLRLEYAAMSLGATRRRAFWEVTVPLVRPAVLSGALFSFIVSFDEVVIALFVSRVETATLPVKMYEAIRWEISPVIAAIATMLIVLSGLVMISALAVRSWGQTGTSQDRYDRGSRPA